MQNACVCVDGWWISAINIVGRHPYPTIVVCFLKVHLATARLVPEVVRGGRLTWNQAKLGPPNNIYCAVPSLDLILFELQDLVFSLSFIFNFKPKLLIWSFKILQLP